MSSVHASVGELGLPEYPLSFSAVLDRIWWILRGNYRIFVKMGTVPAAAVLVTYALMFAGIFAFGVLPLHRAEAPDPQRMVSVLFPIMALACIPIIVAYALFEAAAIQTALVANRGRAGSFRESYGVAWGRLGRIVWLMILRFLWIGLPMAAFFAVIVSVVQFQVLKGGSSPSPGVLFLLLPFVFLGYAGSLVYGVWMALRLGLAVPACLAEEKTAVQSLRRSVLLTRGSRWRIFLVMLVVYAISYAAILVVEMVAIGLIAVVGLIGSGLHIHPKGPLAMIAGGIGALALVAAFLLFMMMTWSSYAVAFSVLYDDQRLRLEGAARTEPA